MGERRTLPPNQQSEGTAAVAEAPPSQPPPQAPFDGSATIFFSDDEGEEFEFPFVSRDSPAGTAAPADELFADGRIRPFYYPAFGHGAAAQPTHPSAAAPPRVRGQLGRLFLEESRERNSSTSSTASTSSSDGGGGELESASPESYCLWTPGGSSSSSPRPSPPRKSGSTGSMARWRRISELVVGRSHSDGKDKFMFFPAPQPSKPNKPKDPAALSSNTTKHHDKPKPSPAIRKQASPAEVEAAHRIVYGGGVPGASPRRTFLPYREELVGFFANVNGVSRSHQHPF
ncbi:hypothetical protein PR202_gb02211 [Eleusine coracana subsp. coracana]|uniref:Uncharacterized protein n=1 Tax=Eleusine coracana subsp. coracana TaxID=191504 RepID=A0AAV5DZJ5_ELECO|nr:hypothetical protein PR202_gb02211 [Eleusine coracana subsp. coracana]